MQNRFSSDLGGPTKLPSRSLAGLWYDGILIGFRFWWMFKSPSGLQLFVTPCTVALGAPLSTGFHRQEYWSGSLFPSPGDLPQPVMELKSPALQVGSSQTVPPGKPGAILSSVAQSCPTLCDPTNHSTPGLPVHHQLPECMPSSHLILGRPLLLLPPIPPSIRVFSNESVLRMR